MKIKGYWFLYIPIVIYLLIVFVYPEFIKLDKLIQTKIVITISIILPIINSLISLDNLELDMIESNLYANSNYYLKRWSLHTFKTFFTKNNTFLCRIISLWIIIFFVYQLHKYLEKKLTITIK